jgi:glycosyltransferase involved in cell wall biosynthesis
MAGSSTVSIALATYNGEAHLGAQLESYLAQERLPDELILSDDASTDGTTRSRKSLPGAHRSL